MLYLAAQLFLLYLGLMMFKTDMQHKLAIFLFAALCMTCVQISFMPFAKGTFGFLPLCFLLSILPHFGDYYKQLKPTVVFGLMALMIFSAIIFAFNSPHMSSLFMKGKLIYTELMQKTFIMAFVMFCIAKEEDLKPAVKYAFIGLIILTALGLVNYVAKQSFWVTAVKPDGLMGDDAGAHYMDNERFRVQSMFGLAFDYGYTCILFAMFFYYVWKKKLIQKKNFWIAEACCLFGVYFCGCRTVHVCYLLAIAVFAMSAYEMRKWILRGIILVILVIIIAPHIPACQEYIEKFQLALNTSTVEMEGGSTIGMRILQLLTVLYYIQGNMLFGMGKDFFKIDLGWADKMEGGTAVDHDLFGLEGVYLSYLLERGFFGYLCYLIFYGVLFWAAFKMRKADPLTFGLFTSSIAAYFFYANATGELNSVVPTMLMMGIAIKLLYVKSEKLNNIIKG